MGNYRTSGNQNLEYCLTCAANEYRDYSIKHGIQRAFNRAASKEDFTVEDIRTRECWVPFKTFTHVKNNSEAAAKADELVLFNHSDIYAIPTDRGTILFYIQ